MTDKIRSFLKKYWILIIAIVFIFFGIIIKDSILVTIWCTTIILDFIGKIKNQILNYIDEKVEEDER